MLMGYRVPPVTAQVYTRPCEAVKPLQHPCSDDHVASNSTVVSALFKRVEAMLFSCATLALRHAFDVLYV